MRGRSEARGAEARDGEIVRRRRDDVAIEGGRRLGVAAETVADKEYVYRWMNDDGGRLLAKTRQDDWDFVGQLGEHVPADEYTTGAAWRVIGKNPDGSAMRAYLVRKRREFYEEDKRKEQKQTEEVTRQISRVGSSVVAGGSGNAMEDGDVYVKTANISRTLNR